MQKKAGAAKSPSTVMDTLANAVSMFQMSNANALAANNGMMINAHPVMRNRREELPKSAAGLVTRSTIMCPW